MHRPHPTGDTVVTSPYGPRKGGHHDGTDFRAPVGHPLIASMDGIAYRSTTGKQGNRVIITNGGTRIGYNHLSRFNITNGQNVKAGDVVGWAGATGNAQGAHLCFWVTINGQFTNPELWLAEGDDDMSWDYKGTGNIDAWQRLNNAERDAAETRKNVAVLSGKVDALIAALAKGDTAINVDALASKVADAIGPDIADDVADELDARASKRLTEVKDA